MYNFNAWEMESTSQSASTENFKSLFHEAYKTNKIYATCNYDKIYATCYYDKVYATNISHGYKNISTVNHNN